MLWIFSIIHIQPLTNIQPLILGCSDEWPDYCPGYKDKYGCTDVPPINGDGDRWKESVNSICPKTCDKCGGVEAPGGGGGGGKCNLVFT